MTPEEMQHFQNQFQEIRDMLLPLPPAVARIEGKTNEIEERLRLKEIADAKKDTEQDGKIAESEEDVTNAFKAIRLHKDGHFWFMGKTVLAVMGCIVAIIVVAGFISKLQGGG